MKFRQLCGVNLNKKFVDLHFKLFCYVMEY